jgi:hypothetical protein
VSFRPPPIATTFSGGVNVDVLQDALKAVLGGEWRVRVSAAAAAPAAAAGESRSDVRDDEAAPDDPTVVEPGGVGDDAAVALLEKSLNARVIGSIDP